MKRHHVILGTRTTANGEVISASSRRSLNGVKVALEGDRIHCPACKSEGVIRCQGPRLPETWMGTSVALEHDLCICRCSQPPTLLAAQSVSFQTVDAGSFMVNRAAAPAVAANPSSGRPGGLNDDEVIVSQHFELTDEAGRPIDGFRYDIYKDGVLHIRNAALSGGRTAVVEGDAELKLVMWAPDSGGRA